MLRGTACLENVTDLCKINLVKINKEILLHGLFLSDGTRIIGLIQSIAINLFDVD